MRTAGPDQIAHTNSLTKATAIRQQICGIMCKHAMSWCSRVDVCIRKDWW